MASTTEYLMGAGSEQVLLTIGRDAVSGASSGNNTIVAASSGKKIRVLGLSLSAAGAVTAKFQSGAGGTDLTGAWTLATGTPLTLGYNPLGWFETDASALLNMVLSGAVSVTGVIVYILI